MIPRLAGHDGPHDISQVLHPPRSKAHLESQVRSVVMFSEGVHIIAERGGNLSMSSVSDAARVECWSVCCLGAVVAAFIPRALC